MLKPPTAKGASVTRAHYLICPSGRKKLNQKKIESLARLDSNSISNHRDSEGGSEQEEDGFENGDCSHGQVRIQSEASSKQVTYRVTMPSQDSTCLTPSGLGLKKALTPTQKQKLGPRVSNPTQSPQNDSENPNSKSPSQHESSLSGYQQVRQSIKYFFAFLFLN